MDSYYVVGLFFGYTNANNIKKIETAKELEKILDLVIFNNKLSVQRTDYYFIKKLISFCITIEGKIDYEKVKHRYEEYLFTINKEGIVDNEKTVIWMKEQRKKKDGVFYAH